MMKALDLTSMPEGAKNVTLGDEEIITVLVEAEAIAEVHIATVDEADHAIGVVVGEDRRCYQVYMLSFIHLKQLLFTKTRFLKTLEFYP